MADNKVTAEVTMERTATLRGSIGLKNIGHIAEAGASAQAAKQSAKESAASATEAYNSAKAAKASEKLATIQAATATSEAKKAEQSANDAAAVVTGGDASFTPAPGKIPLAGSDKKIDAGWLPAEVFMRTESDMKMDRDNVRQMYPGNGFRNWGKHLSSGSEHPINQGLNTLETLPNSVALGREGGSGTSSSDMPVTVVAGFVTEIMNMSFPSDARGGICKLAPPPDGTISFNPNRTPSVIDHMSYVDPKYNSNAGGVRNEGVGRCFEGSVKNGNFRNGTTGWSSSAGCATLTPVSGGVLLTKVNTKSTWEAVQSDIQVTAGEVWRVKATFTISGTKRAGVTIWDQNNAQTVGYSSGVAAWVDYKEAGTYHIDETFVIPSGCSRVQVNFSGDTVVTSATTTLHDVSVSQNSYEPVTHPVDLVGINWFMRKINKGDHVYKHGLIQSRASDIDGVATEDDKKRPDSFFAWYKGDTTSRGLGVPLSEKSFPEQDNITNNPKNKIYRMSNGDVIQFQGRGQSIRSPGNGDWVSSVDSSNGGYLRAADGAYLWAQGAKDDHPTFGPSSGSGASLYCSGQGSVPWKDPSFKAKGIFKASAGYGYAPDNKAGYKGECYFQVLFTCSRLTESAYVEGLNEFGAMACNSNTTASSGQLWYSDGALTPLTLGECFKVVDASRPDGVSTRGAAENSGKIGTPASGRPDGKMCNAIYPGGPGGIVDYRTSAYGIDLMRYAKGWSDVKTGSYRGLEWLKFTEFFDSPWDGDSVPRASVSLKGSNGELFTGVRLGDKVAVRAFDGLSWQPCVVSAISDDLRTVAASPVDGVTKITRYPNRGSGGDGHVFLIGRSMGVSVSGEFLMRNVIATPDEMLKTPRLRGGFMGELVWVPDDGTSRDIELTHPVSSDRPSGLYTNNGGASWVKTPLTSFDATTNALKGVAIQKGYVFVVYYKAFARQTTTTTRLGVEGDRAGVGAVSELSWWENDKWGKLLGYSLTGKIMKDSGSIPTTLSMKSVTIDEGKLYSAGNTHEPTTLKAPTNKSPAAKALNYNASYNGKATIGVIAEELSWDGSSWNDDGTIGGADAITHKLAIPLPYWTDNE